MQGLHADIDSFLLDLDTNFGVMELLDDQELAATGMRDGAVSPPIQPRPSLAGMDDAAIAREAAAMSTAATRLHMDAQHAAELAERARLDMQAHRQDAVKAAKCVSEAQRLPRRMHCARAAVSSRSSCARSSMLVKVGCIWQFRSHSVMHDRI